MVVGVTWPHLNQTNTGVGDNKSARPHTNFTGLSCVKRAKIHVRQLCYLSEVAGTSKAVAVRNTVGRLIICRWLRWEPWNEFHRESVRRDVKVDTFPVSWHLSGYHPQPLHPPTPPPLFPPFRPALLAIGQGIGDWQYPMMCESEPTVIDGKQVKSSQILFLRPRGAHEESIKQEKNEQKEKETI